MSRIGRLAPLLAALIAVQLTAQTQAKPQNTLAAPAAAKPAMRESDYDKFETLGGSALSPDGKWIAYAVTHGGGRGGGGAAAGANAQPAELHYRALPAGEEKTILGASGPTFTASSRWMLYTQSPEAGGRGAGAGGRGAGGGGRGGRGGGAPGGAAPAAGANRNAVAIVDLRSGSTTTMHDVQSFALSSDGIHVALRRYVTDGSTSRGADLVIHDLETGTDVTLGNVAEFAWSDDGATLAMTIDVDGKTGNGVQVLNATSGTLRSLTAGDMLYSDLTWRKKSDDLVIYRSRTDTMFADTSYSVLAFHGVSAPKPVTYVYDFSADASFPKGMRVASYRRPQWSEDGSTLFFGIADRETKAPPPDRNAPQPARVEVWHYKDLREFHTQQVQGNQDRTRTQLVAWHVGQSGIVRLANNYVETVQLSENQKTALVSNEDDYFMEQISGRARRDVYHIDLATGRRTKILTRTEGAPSLSPSGRYVMYTEGNEKGGNWWVYDLTTGTKVNLTAKIPGVFVNMEDDHPVPFHRGYGVAGWLTGEKSLVIYDRFDLWQVNVDGTNPMRLTKGKEDSTIYRADWVGNDDPTIDPAKPILLTATGDYNRKTGFSRITLGQPAQRLMFVDKAIGALAKAKNADVYSYTTQTSEEPPQLFVASGAMNDGRQISHTNAFMSEFAWGKQVLMNYTNKRGDKLQMMLTYPADYQPGKKYPMVVYYYERLSNTFHSFVVPTDRAVYNTSVFSQEGYFVLRPDIWFQARNPGYSGLDCVVSAVKTAEAAVPDIDPKRVGNFGHSWGGYQSAFYAVHNPGIFAASIAGAPLTDLISMYGYSSGNTGAPETGHFEPGQERMQVPLWEDPAAYIRNSAVFQMDSLKIPLLLEEGDADGNVNYYQSMELYNFGRRLGKNVVFLVYEGENHNVARPESQADYHKRQLEWFGHYLKGEPAADWITNGETYLTRKKILDDAGANAPAPTPAAAANPAGGRGGGGRGGGRGGRGGGI